jgi:hypothetical protein
MTDIAAVANLVREVSTTTGTGNLTTAAVDGYQTGAAAFGTADAGAGNPWVFISNQDAAEWEIRQTYWSAATTLVRSGAPAYSSNSNNTVNFSAGTKIVTAAIPAHLLRTLLKSINHGNDIASASTIDLDAATGDYVTITGTTTINAVTLADGRRVLARFASTPQITNGASLVVAGGTRTMAAGDYALFIGDASSVVRVIPLRADGRPVVPTISSFADTLLDDADAAAARATLGAVGLSGDETVGGKKTFSDQAFFAGGSRSGTLVLANDAVGTISVPGTSTRYNLLLIWMTFATTNYLAGFVYCRTGSSPNAPVAVSLYDPSSIFASTTGVLTGTTGTAGKITFSTHTDGLIYIENRIGGTRSFYYQLFTSAS